VFFETTSHFFYLFYFRIIQIYYIHLVKKTPKYWDTAATTPLDKRVLETMLPYLSEFFGNASNNHIYGKQAKNAIDAARINVANIINAEPNEIFFTSGSTESINWALKGYLEENPEKGNHIITTKIEHKAVLNTCQYLESKGFEVTYLDVDSNGKVDINELTNSIKSNTALICIMYVNNETGVIENIPEIGKVARSRNVTFFCDATQAVGKILVDVDSDQIDMLCFSGHKLYGPKGIGVLFIKKGIKLTPLIHGGGQENGLRGGTSNTPLIVGFGKACEIAYSEFDIRMKQTIEERSKVFEILQNEEISENFKDVKKVPNIISLTILKGDADEILMKNAKLFAASTGSACNSNIIEASHVVKNLFPEEIQNKVIRISI
jgi:cysteine desulfurase